MRFAQFISIVANNVVKNDQCYQKMRGFSHDSFKDGWEIWLQCEAFNVLPESRLYTYSRADIYPGSGEKCDFLLQRVDMNLWIELKVLLKRDMVSLIDRFASDLNKITKVKLPEKNNSVGAFAVIPLDGATVFSRDIKDRFREKTKVDLSKIRYIAAKPGVSDLAGAYDTNPEIGADRIVVLYFSEI